MQNIGMIGLGVMGRNLALNIEEKGFSVAAYNRAAETDLLDKFRAESAGKRVVITTELADLVKALERPRKIIMLIKAGAPVDSVLGAIKPLLEPGDMMIDGGNEFFLNTERRSKEMEAAGFRYVGMGVSGGEEGARNGPSLMPGGPRSGYEDLAPILTRIAAQVDDGPCVDYMGPGGAGHYVKMVHNGIEYGDMQLIAETYDVLRTLGGLSNDDLAETFAEWNRGELQSFLIEITAKIFRKRDDDGKHLVDVIMDATGMKGTGKWTVQQASELSAPIPTIASSVEARILSAQKAERVAASKLLPPKTVPVPNLDRKQLIEDVRNALYAAKVCSYAQGMNLIRAASEHYSWGIDLARVSRIWKGGCIIRAQFLDRIKNAFAKDPKLPNLLVDPAFANELGERQPSWRRVVSAGVLSGIALPSMGASLAYFDSYRRERLPANLLQAQRDFFGAHTYQRSDKEGSFHTEWD